MLLACICTLESTFAALLLLVAVADTKMVPLLLLLMVVFGFFRPFSFLLLLPFIVNAVIAIVSDAVVFTVDAVAAASLVVIIC